MDVVLDEPLRRAFPLVKPEDLKSFLALGAERLMALGDEIIRPGVMPEGFTVVRSGRLAIEQDGHWLRDFTRGHFFGEGSLVRDTPPDVRIYAVEASLVLTVPRDAARDFLRTHGNFGFAFMSSLMRENAMRLQATNQLFAENRRLAEELEGRNQDLRAALARGADLNQRLAREVEEREKAEQEARSLARLSAESPMPVLRVTADGRLTYANQPSRRLLDLWNVDLGGLMPSEWQVEVLDTLAAGSSREVELRLGERVFMLTLTPITEAGYVNIYGRDITSDRAQAARILHLANHDPLTGLPNRKMFFERLRAAITACRDSGDTGALLFVDLDHFKEVNDTLGHPVGDQLLQAVAGRLTNAIRANDIIARLGGDEFAIIMLGSVEMEDVRARAERIQQVLCRPFIIEMRRIQIGASIGISFFPEEDQDADELLKHADLAMYQAKRSGRNTHHVFEAGLEERMTEKRQLEEEIGGALDRNEFSLLFQPRIEVASGRIIGAETLLRWHHPELGTLDPERFLEPAERSGHMAPLSDWILSESCRQIARWRQAGHTDLSVSVNLSLHQLRDEKLVDAIAQALDVSGLDPKALELEVSEEQIIRDPDRAIAILRKLSEHGVSLVIDDFGGGYASLTQLRRLPVGKIKIDPTFIRDIHTNDESAAITGAIIALGHGLRLKVAAEWVESAAQLDKLSALGCDEAQGYYFSVPVLAMDFGGLLDGPLPKPAPAAKPAAKKTGRALGKKI